MIYAELLDKTYEEIIDFLLYKYGKVPGDYFLTETCKSRNPKIGRGNEGLEIHHIDEDKAILLSNSNSAINYPFDYQKAEHLVYCNFLEHLILHIKIFEKCEDEYYGVCGAVLYIVPKLNDLYSDMEFSSQMYKTAREKLAVYFDDYIYVLAYFKQLIDSDDLSMALCDEDDLYKQTTGLLNIKVKKAVKLLLR